LRRGEGAPQGHLLGEEALGSSTDPDPVLRIIARKRCKGSVAAIDPSTFPHELWFEHQRGGDSVDEKSYQSTMDPTKLARAAVRIDVRSPLSYPPTFAMLSTLANTDHFHECFGVCRRNGWHMLRSSLESLFDQPKQEGHGDRQPWDSAPLVGRSSILLLAHHEHGAVGVPDNRFRNTAHQRPPYGAKTSATHHDRPCT
jgi:hypothetical protein